MTVKRRPDASRVTIVVWTELGSEVEDKKGQVSERSEDEVVDGL